MVWTKMVQQARDRLTTDLYLTYTANSDTVAMVTASVSLHSVVWAGKLEDSGTLTDSNRARPIFPAPTEDIESQGLSQGDQWIPPEYARYIYAVIGDREIALRPIPTEDIYLFIRYVAYPAALANDADNLLGGDLVAFHDLIVLQTAMLLAQRTGRMVRDLEQQYYRTWMTLVDSLKGSTQLPSGVRHVTEHYD